MVWILVVRFRSLGLWVGDMFRSASSRLWWWSGRKSTCGFVAVLSCRWPNNVQSSVPAASSVRLMMMSERPGVLKVCVGSSVIGQGRGFGIFEYVSCRRKVKRLRIAASIEWRAVFASHESVSMWRTSCQTCEGCSRDSIPLQRSRRRLHHRGHGIRSPT